MEKDYKQVILTYLHQWHALVRKEAELLAAGDLEEFEILNRKSASIQEKLDNILSKKMPQDLGKEIPDLMKKIHTLQSEIAEELEKGTKELAVRIGALRKNKTSLKGYKQYKPKTPRFMNERT